MSDNENQQLPSTEFNNFDYKNDEEPNVDEETDETYKYTKIDCLDEDPCVGSRKYTLVSFLSPEGIMNCNIRGVKVRGNEFYSTQQDAEKAAAELRKKDPNFHIFVAPVGLWVPMDPNTKMVEQETYGNKKMDKFMKNLNKTETEKNLKTLNEMAGRYKENLQKNKTEHKKRIQDARLKSAQEMDTKEQEQTEAEIRRYNKYHDARDVNSTRERLRAKLADKRAKELQKSTNSEDKKRMDQLKEEEKRIKENSDLVEKMTGESNKIQQNLDKMTAIYNELNSKDQE